MAAATTLSKPRQQLTLAVLLLSSLLIWMDNVVLNTAFEVLADPTRGLGATPAELQWATGAYTLVFAALMFAAGSLGDRFGHRTVLVTGLVIFALASVWAAYSGNPGELVTARALMGVGSALIMPATMAILSWAFVGPARATAFGLSSASAGVGMAVGPVVAGILLEHFWWGSVFLINVPVVLLAAVGLVALVPDFRSPTARRMDPAGLLLSISGLSLLAYGLIRAGQVTAWSGVDVWAPVAAGLALLALFVVVELRSRQPSFDPRLLVHRTFGGGTAALGLLLFAMTATLFYSTFYLQGARGFSPLQAGLLMTPSAVGAMIGGPLGVRWARRFTLRVVSSTALIVSAAAMGAFAFFDLRTPLLQLEIVMSVQGIAVGMVMGTVTGALMNALPLEQAGAGSAVTNTVRQTGSVLGIAIGGTLLSITYRQAVEPLAQDLPASVRDQVQISAEQARHAAETLQLPGLADAADTAFIHALHVGSVCAMFVALAGAAVLACTLRSAGKPSVLGGSAGGEAAAADSEPSVAGVAEWPGDGMHGRH